MTPTTVLFIVRSRLQWPPQPPSRHWDRTGNASDPPKTRLVRTGWGHGWFEDQRHTATAHLWIQCPPGTA